MTTTEDRQLLAKRLREARHDRTGSPWENTPGGDTP